MGIVSTFVFTSDNESVTRAKLNNTVANLLTEFNGNISNANISSSAAIAYSKLNLSLSILNADISASAAIVDTKLATISTAGKVSGAALTSLSSTPSGAGVFPVANTNACLLTTDQTVNGIKTFGSIPVLPASNPSSSNEATRKAYVDTLALASILDYGTSASSSTARGQSALRVCFGKITVSGNSSQAITNLPFSSGTSYYALATFVDTASFDDGYPGAVPDSASQLTIVNEQSSSRSIAWFAIGI